MTVNTEKSAEDIIKEQNYLIQEFSELQKAQNETMQEMMQAINDLQFRVDHPVRAGLERVHAKCIEFGQHCAEQYNHLLVERDKLFAATKEIAHTAGSYVVQEAVAMRNSAVGTYNKCLEDISAQMKKINNAIKSMVSKVKSFTNEVKEKAQIITAEIAYRFEKHDLEACVKSIDNLITQDSKRITRLSERLQSCQNFDMALYEAKQGVSNAFHRLNGEPVSHMEYVPSLLFAKIQGHMQENIQSISNDLNVWKHHHNEFSQELQNLKDEHDNR